MTAPSGFAGGGFSASQLCPTVLGVLIIAAVRTSSRGIVRRNRDLIGVYRDLLVGQRVGDVGRAREG
ncbi:hypothetical protein C8039_02175 [Halogeometricum sp. wsp3]|nr:hypothetical protein C8039_02175 [Halogeometricum sp. wsp3]